MNVKATVGAIIEKENKVLLTLRNHEPFNDHWCIPGGHIDFGEEPEQAIKREAKEETGLTVKKLKFFGYYSEIYKEINWHSIALIFICETEGDIKICPKEVKEYKWFDIKEALKQKLAFEHKRVLNDYKEMKK